MFAGRGFSGFWDTFLLRLFSALCVVLCNDCVVPVERELKTFEKCLNTSRHRNVLVENERRFKK